MASSSPLDLLDETSGPENIKWIFSAEVLEHLTPSREKGISSETERRYRREGARFISKASNTLKLRGDTLATGTVFFHRFFMVQNFADFNRYVVAAACVLLAGKVEETPKKCKDIVRVVRQILTNEQAKGFGPNPKDELISLERVLLQTIRFDLQVEHPYSYLLKFAKHMKGEKQRIESVLQMAWTFINDSLCTALCLQWEPPAIAVALLYLAGKLSKFDLQSAFQAKNRSWWRQFVQTVDAHDLDSICHQVLDVYSEEEKEQERLKAAATESSEKHTTSPDMQAPPPPPPLPAPTQQTTPQKIYHTPPTGISGVPTGHSMSSFMTNNTTTSLNNTTSMLPNNSAVYSPVMHQQPHSQQPHSQQTNSHMVYQSLLGQPPRPPPSIGAVPPPPPPTGYNQSPPVRLGGHPYLHRPPHPSHPSANQIPIPGLGLPVLPTSSTHPLPPNYPSSWR